MFIGLEPAPGSCPSNACGGDDALVMKEISAND
jgi:hypothetical protein